MYMYVHIELILFSLKTKNSEDLYILKLFEEKICSCLIKSSDLFYLNLFLVKCS